MTLQKFMRAIPFLSTALVAGLALSIMAPYGTHQFSLIYRVMFWVGLCMAGGLGTMTSQAIIDKAGLELKSWQRVFLHSLGATIFVWVCFLGLNLYLGYAPTAEFYYLTPFYIWVIGVIICGFGELLHRRDASAHSGAARPAIFERLKPALRKADIYALSAEDHYVRIHTSAGDDLVLMRLSDAVKETHPLQGLIPHRSWWVAEAGVHECRNSNSKLTITLKNDVCVPVSRANNKRVRAAGWA